MFKFLHEALYTRAREIKMGNSQRDRITRLAMKMSFTHSRQVGRDVRFEELFEI